MVRPVDEKKLRLKDLRRCGVAKQVFNALFNLTKFMSEENKYPLPPGSRMRHETDWKIWTTTQYELALMSEEVEENNNDRDAT